MNKHEIRLLLEQAEAENATGPAEPEPDTEMYSGPAWGDRLNRIGIGHLQKGEYAEAEEHFKAAIEAYGNCYDEHYETPTEIYRPALHLAECYSFSGRPKDAVQAYLKALETSRLFREFDTENVYWHIDLDIYIAIGRIYAGAGNDEMALFYHEKAVRYINGRTG